MNLKNTLKLLTMSAVFIFPTQAYFSEDEIKVKTSEKSTLELTKLDRPILLLCKNYPLCDDYRKTPDGNVRTQDK